LGAAQLAGFGAAVRLEYLLYPLAFGLGAGVLAIVGTNIGAGNVARAARIAWTAAALAAGVTGCIGLFGATLAGYFGPAYSLRIRKFMSWRRTILLSSASLIRSSGLGLTLASAFQAAGRPLWPLLGITGRALVVAVGGGIAVRLGTDLSDLAVVAASGLIVYGASLTIAFRAGVWRTPRV